MITCPRCKYKIQVSERDEREYNRIQRKKKREEKELKMQYMKELREDKTTLDYPEWLEYQFAKEEDV